MHFIFTCRNNYLITIPSPTSKWCIELANFEYLGAQPMTIQLLITNVLMVIYSNVGLTRKTCRWRRHNRKKTVIFLVKTWLLPRSWIILPCDSLLTPSLIPRSQFRQTNVAKLHRNLHYYRFHAEIFRSVSDIFIPVIVWARPLLMTSPAPIIDGTLAWIIHRNSLIG